MEDHIFHCESCKGCSDFLKRQSQIFMEAKNGVWEKIVMWQKGCSVPSAMSYTTEVDKEVMEDTSQEIEFGVTYEELQGCTITKNEAKLDSLLSPK